MPQAHCREAGLGRRFHAQAEIVVAAMVAQRVRANARVQYEPRSCTGCVMVYLPPSVQVPGVAFESFHERCQESAARRPSATR